MCGVRPRFTGGVCRIFPSSVSKTFFSSGERHYRYFAKGSLERSVVRGFYVYLNLSAFECLLAPVRGGVGWCISPGPLRSKHQDGIKSARIL